LSPKIHTCTCRIGPGSSRSWHRRTCHSCHCRK
jgi:hypothetical protein